LESHSVDLGQKIDAPGFAPEHPDFSGLRELIDGRRAFSESEVEQHAAQLLCVRDRDVDEDVQIFRQTRFTVAGYGVAADQHELYAMRDQ
jgi:hypothetical protein